MSDRERLWSDNRAEFRKRYIRQEYGPEPSRGPRHARIPAIPGKLGPMDASSRISEVLEAVRESGFWETVGTGSLDAVLKAYRAGAAARSLVFELSDEEAAAMIRAACGYCGLLEPDRYNGIDRIDNLQGYTANNSIACCRWCNYAKGRRDVGDFLKWLNWVARRAR